ncbi:MAG: hypothetical protein NT126_02030, partial [Bacteroidetes bacterium]|nr:hypothetical protein [Bacteroidota bacterium]
MNKIRQVAFLSLLFLVISSLSSLGYTYNNGDYRTIASGNWTTVTIWNQMVAGSWVFTGGTPSSGDNAYIAHTVVVNTSNRPCKNLVVEPTGVLYTLSATNAYVDVYGDIICDGVIGNGTTFDGVAFNIEGPSCTVTGTGTFDAARIRKLTALNVTTNLFINRNINLRFNTGSNTQIYDTAAVSFFNVTIGAGDTLNLTGSGVNIGNASINGIDGSKLFKRGGAFTVNGVMLISGSIYLTTADTNTTPTPYTNKWIVNNGGYLKVSSLKCPLSGASKDSLIVNAGGTLELTGVDTVGVGYPFYPFSTTNNGFSFASGSTVIYSGAGNQWLRVKSEFAGVPTTSQEYGNLILSGSGNRPTVTDLYVKNNLTISGTSILNPSSASVIFVGGDWTNYNETGFNEQLTTIRFNGAPGTDATQLPTQTINCPGGEVFYKLIFNKGASIPKPHLTFISPVDVINQLQFASNGSIDLNSNLLTIRNSASTGISTASPLRYIISEKADNSSKIKWKIGVGTGSYVFPFGTLPDSTINYIPVTLNKTAIPADIGDVVISTYGTAANNLPWPSTPTNVSNLSSAILANNTPDNRDWTVDRFWEIDATNSVALTTTLSFRAAELPTSDPLAGNMKAQYWDIAAGKWQLPQLGTGSANKVVITGNVIYNTTWALGSLNSPLPIELLKFDAYPKEQMVITDWSTASEINNDYFTLERSSNGLEFYEIGKIRGAGNSSVTLNYSFPDEHPLTGISYYRLKQTDFDGRFSYSPVVMISYKKDQKFYLYPNPSKDIVYLA